MFIPLLSCETKKQDLIIDKMLIIIRLKGQYNEVMVWFGFVGLGFWDPMMGRPLFGI